MPQEAYRGAGIFREPGLRSLDALHLTVASMIGVDKIATYDNRMAEAARRIGFAIVLPEISAGG